MTARTTPIEAATSRTRKASRSNAAAKTAPPTKPAAAATATMTTAAKAQATRAEGIASGITQVCAGPCATEKPITAFPTTTRNKDGVMGRGKVCRVCRDAGRAAKK